MKLDSRLFRELNNSRLSLALAIGLGLSAGVLTVLLARVLSKVIHRVFLEGMTIQEASGFLFLMLGLLLLRAVLAWGSEVSAAAAAQRVKQDLRQRVFERLMAPGFCQAGQGPQTGERAQTGELSHVLTEGIEALDAYFSQYLPQLALAALVPLTVLLFVFPIDALSGIVLLLTAPLIPLFMILIGNLAGGLTKRQWLAVNRMSAYFLDVLQGLSTLKTFGRSREQVEEIGRVSNHYRETTLSVLRITFLSALVLELVATISTALVAVQVGLRLLYGQGGLSFEEAFFILVLAPEFYLPMRLLGSRFHAGMAGVAAGERIYTILEETDTNQYTVNSNQYTGLDAPQFRFDPSHSLPPIAFDNVAYTYPGGREALKGVSFRIQPGKMTALVGPSGAGKSTVAHLLLRFSQPDSGRILVGDNPVEAISPTAWRQGLAWVPQIPFLFQGSVAENIRLALPGAGDEEVVQAATQACAHKFIMALPQGYETQIGERGARLSAGQAQRIALARAFLKDAPLLILDEATSNLDPETESLLQQATERLVRGRTVLVIAHRVNTVAHADRILVLEDGRLAEAGTHDELVRRGGLYRRLVGDLTGFDKPIRSSFVDRDPAPFEKDLDQESVLTEPARSIPASAPLFRLLRLASPYAWRIALAAFLGFFTVGSGIGLMSTSAFLLARAALHPSIAELQVAIVGVRFFGLARGVFRYLERLLSHDVTLRLLARLRVWFYAALEPLAPARLMAYHSGDLISRIVGDISSLESFYVRALAPPLVAALTALAAGGFLAGFHPLLGLALLAFMALLGLGVPLAVRLAGKAPGQQLIQLRASLSRVVVDGIQGRFDLLAFGQEGAQLARLKKLGDDLAGVQNRMARLQAWQNAAGGLLAGLGMWSVLTLAIPLVRSGQIEGLYLPVIALAALSSFEAMLPLPLAAQYLENHLEAARRLIEIVDGHPAVRVPSVPRAVPEEIGLEVKGLRFRYPAPSPLNSAYVISDLTFCLPHAKRLAIVGPSGSGKTTLAHLLLRFWDFEEGEIRLGGHDIRSYDPEFTRRRMSVVSQNTFLFTATLRENLLVARPGASQEELVQSAQGAQIHDFIQSLPQGYDTWIGEHGLRLSAGQRQRLSIARALLKDAPLLILDEATANLDTLTEREVLKTLYGLMQGRTVLAITHRLVGLEAMDEILVLREGQVVERGRHAKLLEGGGLYRRMWDLQNRLLIP